MLDSEETIKLLDLIDIKFLQDLQDNFANTMNVAVVIYDIEGPVTKPSNFTDFCSKYTGSSKIGAKRCEDCDLKWGNIAAKSGKPMIYNCHTGLVDFVVPIIVEGRHIGSLFGGQILIEKPDEEKFRQLARELDINEDEYIEALRKIKIVPIETINAAINFLYLIANVISKIAHKNLELIKKNKREIILRDIINKIRSSLDIRQIQHEIVNQIGKFFNADGVRITDYDYKSENYVISKEAEYRSSDRIKSFVGVNFKNIRGFNEYVKDEHLKGNDIIFSDIEKYVDEKNLRGTDIEKFYREFGFVSSAAINVYHSNKYVGDFVVTFEHPRTFSDDEIHYLKILADQAGVAMHQAELFEKEKERTEREIILRDIINKIRSSLDIRQIQHEIVNQIGKFFNADGVRIADYDYKSENYVISKEAEYRSSDKIKSFVGVNFKNIRGFNEYVKDEHLKGNDIIFSDIEKYVDEKNLRGTDIEKFGREFGFVSLMGINIYYGDKYIGDFIITFEHPRTFSDDEIHYLKILADQAGVAMHQAELYKKEKKIAEIETFLRKTTEMIRTSLDKNTITQLLVINLGKYFSADRAFFSDFDPKNNRYLPIDKDSEYLSNTKEKSFVGYDWSDDSMIEYIQPLIEKRELNIFCWDEYVEKNSTGQDFISRFEDANVKSSYNFPVLYQEKIMGFFCIEFTKDVCKKLSDEDINTIRHICSQAGIALYHSGLYAKAKSSLGQNGMNYI